MNAPETLDDLIDLANGYFAPRSLLAAARIGAFDALANGARTSAAVAAACNTDERATDLLLRALASIGILEAVPGDPIRFEPRPIATKCLFPDSPECVLPYLRLNADGFDSWARLEESLRTGAPIRVSSRGAREGEADEHRAFILAMRATARINAPLVAAHLDFADVLGREPQSLIDLGGGPGTFAFEFCRRHAGMRATVFDLPETIAIAREAIAEEPEFEVRERVGFRAGDFHRDELGGPYDVAWISHVIHGHPESTLPQLFGKVREAMAPGGLLVVHDFLLDPTRTVPAFPAVFAVNMLVKSDFGRTYSAEELCHMVEAAGFADAQQRDCGERRGIGLVTARAGEA